MTSIVAFDAETVPDVDLALQVMGKKGLPYADVIEWIHKNRNMRRDDPEFFPKILYHKIISLCVAYWSHGDGFDLIRTGDEDATKDPIEAVILEEFSNIIENEGGAKSCQLVSFNGRGFDMPAILQRSLICNIPSPALWDDGREQSTKWNNYQSRFHNAHMDLMDKLSCFMPQCKSRLNDFLIALGLPGKMGVGGPNVAQAYRDRQFAEIHYYCELDALCTFLLYMRYSYVTGELNQTRCNAIGKDIMAWIEDDVGINPIVTQFIEEWEWDKWLKG